MNTATAQQHYSLKVAAILSQDTAAIISNQTR